MEIHFQTTDHVVAVEKVAEQHIATKYSKCNSLRVIIHYITLGKSAITHSKVGQSSSNQKKEGGELETLGISLGFGGWGCEDRRLTSLSMTPIPLELERP